MPRAFRFAVTARWAGSGTRWRDVARRAEDLGYDVLLVTDHMGQQLAPIPALMAAADAFAHDRERETLRILRPIREQLPDSPSVRELAGLAQYRIGNYAAAAKELEAYADRVIDGYAELAPNLKSAILHRQVIGPHTMQEEYGLVGGNIFHGELSVDQLFHMRPAPGYADFRTPVHGLYQASSACHAGGGVCGVPAYLAVKQILSDRKLKRNGARAKAGVAN